MISLIILLSLINTLLVVATFSVLATATIPLLKPFLKYGKTLKSGSNPFINIYVPKRWFTHFYMIHLSLSVLNAHLFIWRQNGNLNDVQSIMILNLIQSARRLYECCYVSKFSQSAKMHIFHYLVGFFFYITINACPCLMYLNGDVEPIETKNIIFPLILFGIASLDQFKNHTVLSRQKKYNLPETGMFRYIVCPHYFDEIMVYLSIALVKPSFSTILMVFWVLVNLSISAKESYEFYKSEDQLKQHQMRIIPFVY